MKHCTLLEPWVLAVAHKPKPSDPNSCQRTQSLSGCFFFSLTAYMCNRRDGGTVVRLQEIPSGWLYKNLSKNRAKLSLVFGHFYQCDNEWFVHDFYIQAKGGCQMCLSAVKLDHSGELFWGTPSWLRAWVSVFWAWRMDLNKGVPRLFAYCEKLIWKIFFYFKQGTCPWMAFAWNFFGIFLIFFF